MTDTKQETRAEPASGSSYTWTNPLAAWGTATVNEQVPSIPVPDPAKRRARRLLQGDVPSPINPPPGCAFGHRMKHWAASKLITAWAPLRVSGTRSGRTSRIAPRSSPVTNGAVRLRRRVR